MIGSVCANLRTIAAGLVILVSCNTLVAAEKPPPNPYEIERSWPPYFLEHQKLFTEKAGTYKAGKYPVWTIHVPGGWIGNSTVIEGDDGLIVYDTSVNMEAGAFIAAEIRKISDKPIKAIFYSHHHSDHYGGTAALVTPEQVADGSVKIYAWDNFEEEIANEFGAILPRQIMGVFYYGPDLLPPEDKHHHGCCCAQDPGRSRSGYIPPTDTFSEDAEHWRSPGSSSRVFYTLAARRYRSLACPSAGLRYGADRRRVLLRPGQRPLDSRLQAAAARELLESAGHWCARSSPQWLLGSHIMPLDRAREEIQRVCDRQPRRHPVPVGSGVSATSTRATPRPSCSSSFVELPALPGPRALSPDPMYGTPWIIAPELYTGWVSWFSGDATDLLPTAPVAKGAALAWP